MSATAALNPRSTFIPRADTQVLWPNQKPPPPRPANLPLLRGDHDNAARPIGPWDEDYLERNLPKSTESCTASPVPPEPEDPAVTYLFPVLSKNERLRLTLLWYYTRGFDADHALLFRLQEKVRLVQEIMGWDMVITGILDNEKYTSLATVGLPLATYPRRESACAHTINNRGTTLVVPDTQQDWRFRQAPHFKPGGLRAYAGFPLHVDTDFGEKISLGSLCVVSTSPQEPLSLTQHAALTGFADMIAAEIVHASKLRRQRERHQMSERVAKLQEKLQEIDAEALIMAALQERYPQTIISVQSSDSGLIAVAERDPIQFHDMVGGVWEDTEFLESQILNNNQQQFIASRTVRALASRCAHFQTPTFLVVASSEVQYVFDDVDAWFVERCASALSTVQQERNLQKALKAKELFLRGMTHQLRTPIHGVLGAVELLAEELGSLGTDYPLSPTEPASGFNASPFIRTIRTSGRDLMSIVDSMLKLNRLDDITHKPTRASLSDLKDMETDIMNDLLQTTPEDSLQHVSVFFHNKLAPDCATLTIDLHLLKDSLQHLVMNAIQNTASGNVNITIQTSDDKRTLLVDVEDNGKGIGAQDQSRIFDAFEKIDIHSKGVGLGLTLASRLATVMSGSLTLKSSEVDKGSHFQMEFRNPDFAPTADPEQPLHEQLIHLPFSFCIEASPTNSESVGARFGNYLEEHGFEKVDSKSAPLTIIDCSTSDSHLTEVVASIDTSHVAIYLVPAGTNTEELVFLSNKRNVVTLPGPFTSNNLFNALRNADAVYNLYNQNQDTTAVIDHSTDIPSSIAMTHAALESSSHLTHCVSQSPLYSAIKLEPTIQILPATPSSPPSVDLPTPPPPADPFALLVDDNAINLQIMTMYCKKRKIPYITAADGAEAVAHYLAPSFRLPHHDQRVNLVLMDLQMPVRDGISATSDIRKLEVENGWNRAAVLMVTGQDSPSDRIRAAEAGADAFLVKPVAMRTLDQGIKSFFPDFLGS